MTWMTEARIPSMSRPASAVPAGTRRSSDNDRSDERATILRIGRVYPSGNGAAARILRDQRSGGS